MIKLALNSTYGNSNNKFSFFYDPKFTMSITVNGQLLICKLAEMVITVPTVRIIMVNTDGIEYTVHPDYKEQAVSKCNEWQVLTKLQLEGASYSKMWIKDVNNYIALYSNGKVKRKGCFEYELGWHQNHSSIVIPKVAERVLVYSEPIRELVEGWGEPLDFLLRTKINRGSHLTIDVAGVNEKLQNNTRYVVSKSGGFLYKWMPPLKGKSEWRKLAVQSGWRSKVCNQLKDFDRSDVDYEYYIREIEKLVLPLGEFK
jgi:DNA polymerase elongation subunit (family B)